jgi:hypothetical protein
VKPADLRNATWREVLTHLTEDMVRVHLAWQAYGPGTTREVARLSGIPLLTLRPRTTDLHKLGLVELTGAHKGRGTNEGVYSYVERDQAEAGGQWRARADFTKGTEPSRGFPTVDAAISALSDQEKAALGARLMSQFGHHLKRRQPGSGQLELIPA